MKDFPVWLKNYFLRIGYAGVPQLNRETLYEIQRRQVRSIPFENLDVLWNRGIQIDLHSIQTKLIDQKRGGYCFEQNTLLAAVLREIGFQVDYFAARGLYQVPEGTIRPRTHMALRASLDGTDYLLDAGFGGFSLPEPVPWRLGEIAVTTHHHYRLMTVGEEIDLEVEVEGVWISLYRMVSTPQLLVDYVLPNWYVSTHPQSHFRPHLLMARVSEEGRYSLRDHLWSFYPFQGVPEKRAIKGFSELIRVLKEDFLLEFYQEEDLRDLNGLSKQWNGF